MQRTSGLPVTENHDFEVAEVSDHNAAREAVPELHTPAAREIIEIIVGKNTLSVILDAAEEQGVKVTITSDGKPGLRYPNGGLVELIGTEDFVSAVVSGKGLLHGAKIGPQLQHQHSQENPLRVNLHLMRSQAAGEEYAVQSGIQALCLRLGVKQIAGALLGGDALFGA